MNHRSDPGAAARRRRGPLAKLLPALFVGLALIATGCISGAAGPAPSSAGAGDAANDLRTPLELPQDRQAREPNIAIMEDGTIFVTGQGAGVKKANLAEGASWLWRSRDDGATWATIRSPYEGNAPEDPGLTPASIRCACDADVVVSPDGWVYYTDWWVVPPGPATTGKFVVERSSDGGDTWASTIVPLPNDGWFTVDRQWLLAGDDGFVALFYHTWTETDLAIHGAGARIDVVVSHDHGATWSLPTTVAGVPSAVFLAPAHPRMLADGTLLMAFMEFRPNDERQCHLLIGCSGILELPATVRVARSIDEGATWRIAEAAVAPDGVGAALPIGVAADATDRVVVAYNARVGDHILVHTVESTDGGRTWGTATPLQDEGLNVLPWVAATPEGRFAIGWYSADATGPTGEVDEETPWHVYLAQRLAPHAPWRTRLVDPEPVVTGPYCFGGDTCSSNERPLGDFLSVEYGPDGALHIAYAREAEGPSIRAGSIVIVPSSMVGHVWYTQVDAKDSRRE